VPPHPPAPVLTRRAAMAGVCGAACAAALSACASYGPATAPAPTAAPAPAPSAGPQPGGSGTGGSASALARTADIPVGGGAVFAEQDVVVTQPAAGEFKAFSATCTHQGCTVDKVEGGTIDCPCHSSRFAVEDGAPVAGPANRPLPERAIRVDGQSIVLA
jgi:Rieske Fe-S protein